MKIKKEVITSIGILIVGGGKGGKALLKILLPKDNGYSREIKIIGVVDKRKNAPGIKLAQELGIPTSADYHEFMKNEDLSMIVDVTGNLQVSKEINRIKPKNVELMGGTLAKLLWGLVERVSGSERRIRNYVNSLITLSRLSQTVSSTLDLEKVLDLVVKQAVKILNANVCSLRLLDETGENLVLVATVGHSKEYIEKKRILKLKESIAGLAVLEKKAITIEDVQKDLRYIHPELARGEKIHSLLSVPLVEKESGPSEPETDLKVIGVLNVYTRRKHIFSKEEKELLSLFARQSALAIVNARLYEKIEDYSRNLEKKVKEQTEKLLYQEKLAAIGQLSSGIAHELRNPLAVIKSAAYYLRNIYRTDGEKTELLAKTTKHLDFIEKEVTISVRIIDDLLEFARIPKLSLAPVNVNQVLEESLELVEKPKEITLGKDFLADLPLIEADASRLRQVFSNLASNAYDALSERIPGGDTNPELLISTKVKNDLVEIVFQDNGCGITKENLEKVFDPLFTTKSKGTGLGLPVCKSILTAHQGNLKVESEINKGTTFIVELPIAQMTADK